MGLFHKTLKDIGRNIEKEDYVGALAILEEHLSSEEEFMVDLNGLQVVISTYQQRLKEIKALLKARGKIEEGITEAVGRSRNIIASTVKSYQQQLSKKINEAQKNCEEVEAILAKLWRKDRKKLE